MNRLKKMQTQTSGVTETMKSPMYYMSHLANPIQGPEILNGMTEST